MATIPEQLAAAAAAPTNTLKFGAKPASFTQNPYWTEPGVWSAAVGWRPGPGNGGVYYNVAKIGRPGFVLVLQETVNVTLEGGPFLTLYSGTAEAPSGYIMAARFKEAGKYEVSLTRWIAGVATALGTVKVPIAAGHGFAIVAKSATKVAVYYREKTGAVWTQIIEAEDATITEGFSSIGGFAAEAPQINFATGLLVPRDGEATASIQFTAEADAALKSGEASSTVPLEASVFGDKAPHSDGEAAVPFTTDVDGEKTEPVISQTFSLEGNILYNAQQQ